MKEGDVFRKASKIYKELDEVEDFIRNMRKKHGESVEASLSILEKSKSAFLERGFEIAFSYIPGSEEDKMGGLDSLRFLLNSIEKNLPPLKLFASSEIIHRKALELRFKTTNPFLFRESRNTLREIESDLDDLDEKSLSESQGKDIENHIGGYDKLIRRTDLLEDAIQEEKRSGIFSYLIKFLAFISGWIAVFLVVASGETQSVFRDITFYLLLGISVVLVVLFLSVWNHLSYGFRHIRRNRSLLAVHSATALLLALFWLFLFYEGNETLELLEILCSIFVFILYLSTISFIYCGDYKNILLRNEIDSIYEKFSGKML
jgi:hypothetical protein